MKINKLIIKNINSLAGEHTIDFDEINERSEGVWLIVGATGSGKTTILDSITLGLFGTVKRLGDISAGNIEKTGSIITHGAKDARVDVQFTVKGQLYTTRWEIRHKVRSAGCEPAKMSLFDSNDQLIESGINPARKKIVEIIGMNFDQFNKSILLAQGDFASFLKSKFSEKADILEKITGTEHYSKIGKAIFDKNNELKSSADQIQFSLNNLSIKSDEEIEELNGKIQVLSKQVKDYLQRLTILNDLLNDRKTYTREIEQLKLIEEKLISNKSELELIQNSHGDKIKRFDAALEVRPAYDSHKVLNEEIKFHESKKIELNNEKIKYEQNQTLIYDKANEVTTIEKTSETFLIQIRKFKEEVKQIENSFKQVENNKNSCHKSLKIEIDRIRDEELSKAFNNEDTLFLNDLLEKRKIKLTSEIESLRSEINIKDINSELLESHQNNLDKAVALQHLVEKYKEIISRIKVKEDSLEKNETNHKELSSSVTNKKIEQIVLTKTFQDKETILNQQIKILSMEQHRHNLNEGEDCPLCGAPDGPLRHHEPSSPDNYRRDYDEAKKILEEHKSWLIRTEAELTGISRTVESQKSEIAEFKIQKEKISEEITSKKNELGISESLNDEQVLVNKINEIKKAIISIKTILKHKEVLPFIEQAMVCNEEKQEAEKNEKKLKDQIKELFPLDQPIQKWADELEAAFESNLTHIRNSEREFSNIETLLKNNRSKAEFLSAEINNFISNNHLESILQLEEIFALQSQVSSWKSVIEKLQREISTNESMFKAGSEKITELEKRIDLTIDLESYEAEKQELNEKITTKSQELGGIKSQLDQHLANVSKGELLRKELDKIEDSWKPIRILNGLIGSATGHHFKNIAQKITLSHLAVLANKHLSIMNDRYKFKFDTKELWSKEEADLMIYDDFDPDGLRSCATLSGGETFIASLALALGLSDFASETSKIESLFIDEGFGTLDPDTLEMAISALEKIRSAGNKTLCLITHVEAMKDRIPYHLVVEKGRRGMSTVRFEMAG